MVKFVPTYADHLARYVFALEHCYKRKVLDVGCKDGDCSLIISYGATSLDLADVNEGFLEAAKKNVYECPVEFHRVDLEKDFPEGEWDTITAFEILEHLENPEFLVKNVYKHLKDGGSFVFSVPNMVANREHKVLFDRQKIRDLISKYFVITEFYEQKRKTISFEPTYRGLLCYVGVGRKIDIKEIYNQDYYIGINYAEEKEAKKNMLRIFRLYKWNPKTVLDVGCGKGVFVQLLRSMGVEAYGTDFSDYAGGLIPEWFTKHDATTPFPFGDKQFDLVISSSFLEHLREEDIDKVADEMRRMGKRVAALIGFKSKKVTGIQSHLTIKDKGWWQNKLKDITIL